MNETFGIDKFEKNFVVEYPAAINDLLEETFKTSSRIKLNCFDVSPNFIVFGANNGSIYIYNRGESITFSKLIPNKNSETIERISISPKEENLLVSDESGLMSILEKCMNEENFTFHVYTELKGRKLTFLKWDGDDRIYMGDNEGTVSVISIPNLVSLALLHTSYVSLMDLGAPIVQIDVFLRFLLVTTEKKTFICDTEREMYKQVGKRESKKALGACFYDPFRELGGLHETVEDFSVYLLYCARPGLRIWQANFEGEVSFTFNYRKIPSKITEIIKFNEKISSNFETEQISDHKIEDEEQFGTIFVFNSKYLVVNGPKALFIIDPQRNNLVFRYPHSNEIEIRVVESEIHIWNRDTCQFRTLNMYSFEKLMAELNKFKFFQTGVEIILKNRADVVKWAQCSLSVDILKSFQRVNSIELDEILKEIEEFEKEKLSEYSKNDDPKIQNSPIKVSKLIKTEDKFELIHRQYRINNFMIPFNESSNLNDMFELLKNFMSYLEKNGEKIHMEWFYKQFLHNSNLKSNSLTDNISEGVLDFLAESFIEVNKNSRFSCKYCSFPLSPRRTPPEYCEVGKFLLQTKKKSHILKIVPYLHIFRIKQLENATEIEQNLPLIIQFGYYEILKQFQRHQVTYDFCDKFIDLFAKLKRGTCLNCGKRLRNFENATVPTWESLGIDMINLIDASNVLKLFLSKSEEIPKNELSRNFYQACISSTIKRERLNSTPELGLIQIFN